MTGARRTWASIHDFGATGAGRGAHRWGRGRVRKKIRHCRRGLKGTDLFFCDSKTSQDFLDFSRMEYYECLNSVLTKTLHIIASLHCQVILKQITVLLVSSLELSINF
jgi:hypothetical protein